MTIEQDKKIRKIAEKFKKQMQDIVDDDKSSVTSISIGIEGEMHEIAKTTSNKNNR